MQRFQLNVSAARISARSPLMLDSEKSGSFKASSYTLARVKSSTYELLVNRNSRKLSATRMIWVRLSTISDSEFYRDRKQEPSYAGNALPTVSGTNQGTMRPSM